MRLLFTAALAIAISTPALAGSLTPPGAPSPTMKTLDEVEPRTPLNAVAGSPGALHLIDAPGSYYLTSNLTAPAGINAIDVFASGVTLDLNGFEIDGAGVALNGITVGDYEGITIRNGTIRNMTVSGINGSMDRSVVEGISVLDCQVDGIRVDFANVIRDCTVHQVGGAGISGGRRTIVEGSFVNETGTGTGIEVGYESRVVDCTVEYTGDGGIEVGTESYISGCNVAHTGGKGVFVGHRGVILDSNIVFSTGWGIELESNSKASRCLVEQSSSTGIVGRTGVTIENCKVRSNGDSGIYVEDSSEVIGNQVTANNFNNYQVYGGIVAPLDGCVIKDNVLSGNGTNLIVSGVNSTVVRNISSNPFVVGYSIGADNNVGAMVSDPAMAGPWDNIDN